MKLKKVFKRKKKVNDFEKVKLMWEELHVTIALIIAPDPNLVQNQSLQE